MNSNFDLFIGRIKNNIMCNLKRTRTRNLSSAEERAMKELIQDESIIIRPSEKGSQIVIMNTSDYTEKVEKN